MASSGLLARLRDARIVRLATSVRARLNHEGAGLFANAIAYSAFLSLFPLLLLGLSAIGWFFSGNPAAQHEWTDKLAGAVPGGGTLIRENFAAVIEHRASTGLIGVVVLLWGGLGLVQSSGQALSVIFQIPSYRGLVRTKVWAVASMVGVGSIGLASLAMVGLFGRGFGAGSVIGLIVLTLISVLIDVAVFLIAYRTLTQRRGPRFRVLLPGAVFAAFGWNILKLGGAWYAARTVSRVGLVYGTFASTIGLLVLLALGARVFLYGAALSAVLAHNRTGAGVRSTDDHWSTRQAIPNPLEPKVLMKEAAS